MQTLVSTKDVYETGPHLQSGIIHPWRLRPENVRHVQAGSNGGFAMLKSGEFITATYNPLNHTYSCGRDNQRGDTLTLDHNQERCQAVFERLQQLSETLHSEE